MGWFKKLTGISSTDFMDTFYPESYKKQAVKWGDDTIKMPLSEGAAPTAPTPEDQTGRLTQAEIDANLEQSKKMARLGKYFTSPLGVLSNATTAGQKIFS